MAKMTETELTAKYEAVLAEAERTVEIVVNNAPHDAVLELAQDQLDWAVRGMKDAAFAVADAPRNYAARQKALTKAINEVVAARLFLALAQSK